MATDVAPRRHRGGSGPFRAISILVQPSAAVSFSASAQRYRACVECGRVFWPSNTRQRFCCFPCALSGREP